MKPFVLLLSIAAMASSALNAQTAALQCPVQQTAARNGSAPNPELIKKLIRCKKGEKAVKPGEEGAVVVEITNLLVGQSRPWSYRQDIGSGKAETVVYPVKVTYTVKTLYRKATEIEANWVRVVNIYVDSFGEWRIGSEEPVQSPAVSRVPNG
jgi:hypothetical protein